MTCIKTVYMYGYFTLELKSYRPPYSSVQQVSDKKRDNC